jgi:hypothetical protein
MPFNLDLPEPWASRGWRVKIRDRERLEPPHVTILQRAQAWRFDLRSEKFLDKDPDPTGVPTDVVNEILSNLRRLSASMGRDVSGEPRVLEGA